MGHFGQPLDLRVMALALIPLQPALRNWILQHLHPRVDIAHQIT
jgi:hypothetical protein